MINFTKKQQIAILIIVVLIFIVGYKIIDKDQQQGILVEDEELFFDNEIENNIDDDSKVSNNKDEGQAEIVIHITGEINEPGIVTLKEDDRIIDAIKEAGGLTSSADESKINLAKKLLDEDKVYIPKIGEDIESDSMSDDINIISNENKSEGSSNVTGSGKININIASKEELKMLPGIGEATAQKIIDYREASKFNSIEDIMKVSGIGEKKFQAIKEMIIAR
ncbi:ComE operon protein 1 [Gottschalkia acidurici 9a]|uniref:ComE operon protein 1 n=1 Tax=Gottschalkia acidurici (strain ATCC 7906 / DSM 604 / BCRC 14475 / CIP 104303 / KCTC 5404 / NCIMB 10678 / 9a) TaxID=1128398 RepID=K0B2Y1_GOTA9|nr:helix-hairpin-helix domain-containing protein [Gottschalkia acidurici]AFS78976.1 ComE operon protein 1 [Gottschalkia acidurici 9a]